MNKFKTKIRWKYFLILLSIISVASFASADTLTFDSGGSANLSVSANIFENFLFPPVCGNNYIETVSEQCDDGNTNGGDGCSSTCQVESAWTCVGNPSACAQTTTTTTTTSSGGGGGGGALAVPSITVSPTEFNVNIQISTNVEKFVSVSNIGTTSATVSISQQNLNDKIILGETSLQLAAGETKQFKVTFVAPSEPGIYTGKIIVGGKEILVSLNAQTKLLLFDSNIIVLNKDYSVPRGDKLNTRVTLIPLGDQSRIDVTLNYIVKDYSGKIFLTQSETLLVDSQKNLNKDFDTGQLPLGQYVVGLELVYPNGVAPSSARFQVITAAPFSLSNIVLYLIMMILIISIMIVVLLIINKLKERTGE